MPRLREVRTFWQYVVLLGGMFVGTQVLAAIPVFINEFHYDHVGTDSGEFIEIAGPAGTDLTGWTIVLYNGLNSSVYGTESLTGLIPDQSGGFGTVSISYPSNGIQNGDPDGFALVNNGTVVQFLSYEGVITAIDGPASGMTSTDIELSESTLTPIDSSLHLIGTGTTYENFIWAVSSGANTQGAINTGQSFGIDTTAPTLSTTTPANNASNIAVNSDLIAHFSENVQKGTSGDISIHLVSDNSTVETIPISSAQVSISDGTTVSINPNSDLTTSTAYYITIASSAIKDLSSNDYAGINGNSVWSFTTADPASSTIRINEVDADTVGTDALEFIELYDGGVGNTALDGLVVVFYNGNSDTSYGAFDLDSYSTNADGFFVLGNEGVAGVSLTFAGNALQNGADAVALYQANNTDFPNGTALTTLNLLDAVVYSTGDADDTGLLTGLGETTQFDENANGDQAAHSNSRVPDGTGSFIAQTPTPNATNSPSNDPEPTNHPTVFVATANSSSQITSTWTDATGGQLPAGYLLMCATSNSFSDPVDGTAQSDDSSCADGSGVQNIVQGTSTASWTGLTANTQYFFKIFPYSNAASLIDYKTDGVLLTTNATTNAVATVTCDKTAPVDTCIHEIQGNLVTQQAGSDLSTFNGGHHDDKSPLSGNTVTIKGVVVADYQSTNLNGFFVQEEDSDIDDDANSSEGIFVYCNTCPDAVNEGNIVQVTGVVGEYYGMTQVTATASGAVVVSNAGNNLSLVSAVSIDLPVVGDVDDFYEQYEGMLVQFTDTLSVAEHYQLSRYGQITLYEGGVPYQYSHDNYPLTTVGYAAHQAELATRRIILDDDNNLQNQSSGSSTLPIFYPLPNGLSTGTQGTHYFRTGDTLSNLTGVLHFSFAGEVGTNAWRTRPTSATTTHFTVTNQRPATPPSVGGNIKVASFNVLNFFDGASFPTARGASSAAELTRQTQKIVSALAAIDADVIGLMELENDANAISTLVNALNSTMGAGTYAYINTGIIGSDEITVGILYKTAVVSPLGSHAVLSSAAFLDPNSSGTDKNRPAVAQTFQVNAGNPDSGEAFTVVVNHFKSKGSSCGAGDDDTTTGQGNCNDTRTQAAAVLTAWLTTDPTDTATNLGAVDTDILIIGDLNAYAKEDPVQAILTGSGGISYQDMLSTFGNGTAYSYVFNGERGYLDHALASNSLASQVTGAADWHINADEITDFDYNDGVKDTGEADYEVKSTANSLYEANAFSSSDHDPVIIGLDLSSGYQLTLNTTGSGTGTVSSTGTPTGTDCGTNCLRYLSTTTVTLNANPTGGSSFNAWSCDNGFSSGNALTADTICTASFSAAEPINYGLILQTEGDGAGTLSGTTAGSYVSGSRIELIATADTGSSFAGWTPESCATPFNLWSDTTCIARFDLVTSITEHGLSLHTTGNGSGSITGTEAGIYPDGTSISLQAVAAIGSEFVSWTPASCASEFTLLVDTTCTATFSVQAVTPVPEPVLEVPPTEPTPEPTPEPEPDSTPDTDNTPPELLQPIPDLVLSQDDVAVSVDLSNYFADPESALSYTLVANTHPEVVGVELETTILQFNLDTVGSSEITVQVTNAENLSLSKTFTITVNAREPAKAVNSTPTCPNVEEFEGTCNARGLLITFQEIAETGIVGNAVIDTLIENNGWIVSSTVLPQGMIQGGYLSGFINNNGVLKDIEFRGGWLKGGILAGNILNSSVINGYLQDVQLAAGTTVRGVTLRGTVLGDAVEPAILENLTIHNNAYLEHVIIGENVELPDNIQFGAGVRFASQFPCKPNMFRLDLEDASNNDLAACLARFSDVAVITTNPTDRGQAADAFVIAIEQNSTVLSLDRNHDWQTIEPLIAEILTMEQFTALPFTLEIDVPRDALPEGEYIIYLGYRLVNGEIVYRHF